MAALLEDVITGTAVRHLVLAVAILPVSFVLRHRDSPIQAGPGQGRRSQGLGALAAGGFPT